MQLPAHLQNKQTRDLGQTLSQNLGTASPPYVSIAGGRFNLIDAAGNEAPVATFDPAIGVYLDACVIDVGDHISKVFYAKAYDPSAQAFSPPDCWSDNGTGPSISASAPQSPTCAACPNAVWGSAISAMGKQIPACSMVQKVALLIPGHPQAIFLLRVPPNSHKHLRAYVELSRGSGVNLADVITRISFDLTTQGTLLFKAVTWIDEAVAQVRESAYTEKKTDALVGRTDVARPAGAIAAPVAVPQLQHAVSNQVTGMGDQNVPMAVPSAFIPPQQVQQPPFQPAPTVQPVAPTATGAGFATQPASPSDPAPAQRRRRRTPAEMQAAQTPPPPGQPQGTPAAAPQAPFPHPGQANQAPNPAPQGSFGMAPGQPAAANPELSSMLDDFFKS